MIQGRIFRLGGPGREFLVQHVVYTEVQDGHGDRRWSSKSNILWESAPVPLSKFVQRTRTGLVELNQNVQECRGRCVREDFRRWYDHHPTAIAHVDATQQDIETAYDHCGVCLLEKRESRQEIKGGNVNGPGQRRLQNPGNTVGVQDV